MEDPVFNENSAIAINSSPEETTQQRNRVTFEDASALEGEEEDDQALNPSLSAAETEVNNSVEIVKPDKCRPTIEPVLFLQMFAYGISAVSIQSFYMERICLSIYNQNESICSNLTSNSTRKQENNVEEIYSMYSTYQTVIELALPILFSMFLAPWLDKNGSKLGLVLPLTGIFTSSLTYLMFSFVPSSSPFAKPSLLLFASVPISLTGGLVALLLSTFAYIANITTVENRTFRIAILEGSWLIGLPIGILIGAEILHAGSYPAVFLTSTCLYGLALLYAIFLVKNDKERIDSNNGPRRFCQVIVEFFDISAFIETLRTVFRKRSGNKRLLIILLLFAICLRLLVWLGPSKITYPFTRHQFGWTEGQYSAYTTIDGLISIAGTAALTVFGMKMLKIPDTVLGIIGICSAIAGVIIWAFAAKPFMMYLGAAAQSFSGLVSIVIRSMISKLVPQSETGKIFSFLSTAEATVPLFSTSLFNYLYQESLKSSFIGTVYLVCAGFNGGILLLFIYFHLAMNGRTIQHDELQNEESDAE